MVGSRSAREDFTEKAKLQAMSVLGGKSVFGSRNTECKGPGGRSMPSKFRTARKCMVSLEANCVEPYRSLKDFGFYS